MVTEGHYQCMNCQQTRYFNFLICNRCNHYGSPRYIRYAPINSNQLKGYKYDSNQFIKDKQCCGLKTSQRRICLIITGLIIMGIGFLFIFGPVFDEDYGLVYGSTTIFIGVLFIIVGICFPDLRHQNQTNMEKYEQQFNAKINKRQSLDGIRQKA